MPGKGRGSLQRAHRLGWLALPAKVRGRYMRCGDGRGETARRVVEREKKQDGDEAALAEKS